MQALVDNETTVHEDSNDGTEVDERNDYEEDIGEGLEEQGVGSFSSW
jgi:hypothetical protein